MKYWLGFLLCLLIGSSANAADLSAIALTPLNGAQQKLSNYQGKYVLIHFWASWCAPCIAEFPSLVKLAADKPDITILAVSVDEESKQAIAFLQKQAAAKQYPKPLKQISNFVLLQDPKKALAQNFGTFQYPETVLLNPQLQPIYKWAGPQVWNTELLQQAMKPN